MAQACFPNDGLNGGKGHSDADVLYIVFSDQVPDGVGQETIDISKLKELGDQQAKLLQTALGSSGGSSSGNSTAPPRRREDQNRRQEGR